MCCELLILRLGEAGRARGRARPAAPAPPATDSARASGGIAAARLRAARPPNSRVLPCDWPRADYRQSALGARRRNCAKPRLASLGQSSPSAAPNVRRRGFAQSARRWAIICARSQHGSTRLFGGRAARSLARSDSTLARAESLALEPLAALYRALGPLRRDAELSSSQHIAAATIPSSAPPREPARAARAPAFAPAASVRVLRQSNAGLARWFATRWRGRRRPHG